MRPKLGYIIIVFSIIVTLNLYYLSKSNPAAISLNPWLSASQVLALVGIVLFSFTFVLSSRAAFLENWFGGLDKVTKAHHLLGSLSFLALVNHPLFLAVNVLPSLSIAANYFVLSQDASYNYGVISLYIMILSLIFTFLIKLPYNLWLKTHDFLGLTLLFACFHVLYIQSDISRYLPLRLWIFLALGIAVFSYIYKVFLYRWFGPSYHYLVQEVRNLGDILEIHLSPESRPLPFHPGQFAFVSFRHPDLTEVHPFSFSSSPDNTTLRFSVKIAGDYTLKLKNLPPHTPATLWGSYGRLSYGFHAKGDVVCIAGGIGITPFLSLISYEIAHPIPREVYLFYCAKSLSQAHYHQELEAYQEKLPNFHYYPYFSDQNSRLTAAHIRDTVSGLTGKAFYLCGPSSLMNSLETQLQDLKISSSKIIFEDFSLK